MAGTKTKLTRSIGTWWNERDKVVKAEEGHKGAQSGSKQAGGEGEVVVGDFQAK